VTAARHRCRASTGPPDPTLRRIALQRLAFVVAEVEVGEFIPTTINPVRRLPGLIAAENLLLDRHTDLAENRLVALERAPKCRLVRRVLAA